MDQILTLKIEAVGQKAILANGVWYNVGNKANCKIADFVKGNTYTVEVADSDYKGKQYHFINKLNGSQSFGPTPAPAAAPNPGNPPPPAAGRTESGKSYDYKLSVKDLVIIRQNAMSNAMTSPLLASLAATVTDGEAVKGLVTEYATLSEEFVLRGLERPA